MEASSSEFPETTHWINGIAAPSGNGNVVRLFCFPHAGGGASVFRGWPGALGPGIEIYPIQLPGREGRWLEPPLTHVSDLVPTLAAALRPLLRPPYAFFGHSMGAFIAFELARHLRRENRPGPSVLIVSAARAPQIPDPDPPLHTLPADLLLEELKRFDGIAEELLNEPELISLLLPILRADLAMCESYEYLDEPPLECSISAYGAAQDEKVELEQLTPWRAQTSKDFQLRIFPGNHFFFLKEARVGVTEALREELRPWTAGLADATGVAPRAQLERLIANVWAELLRVPQVGIDDNFFDLGGNSLLMVQAFGKLREASMTTLSIVDLFRYPTVRLLASAIGGEPTSFGELASPAVAEKR